MLAQDCSHNIYCWVIFVWKSAIRVVLCDLWHRNSSLTFCDCKTSGLNTLVGICASEMFCVESKVRATLFLNHWDDFHTVGASSWPHRAAALKETSRNLLDTSKCGSNNFTYTVFYGGDVHSRIRPKAESCKMKQSLYSMSLDTTENIDEGRKLKHHSLW